MQYGMLDLLKAFKPFDVFFKHFIESASLSDISDSPTSLFLQFLKEQQQGKFQEGKKKGMFYFFDV